MGQEFSLSRKSSRGEQRGSCGLGKLYRCKVYAQNKKSMEVFARQMEGLRKKTSYLAFPWAQDMHSRLHPAHLSRLYADYTAILQENCRRDGQQEQVFQAEALRAHFLQEVRGRWNYHAPLCPVALRGLLLECKSYFMVLHWLHKVASLHPIPDTEKAGQEVFVRFAREEPVFETAIQAAALTHARHLQLQQASTVLEEGYGPALSELLAQVRAVRRCRRFHEREAAVVGVQEALRGEAESLSSKLEVFVRLLGDSQVFAHLLVIRELGTADVSFLWTALYAHRFAQLSP